MASRSILDLRTPAMPADALWFSSAGLHIGSRLVSRCDYRRVPPSRVDRCLLALVCTGGHAISNDPRIRQLGLEPGVPLPRMDVMIVRTLGPGQRVYYESFCEMSHVWTAPDAP